MHPHDSTQMKQPPDDEVLLVEDREGVRWLTLNRPHKLNALDTCLSERLFEALKEADGDDAVRAVLLRGAGRSFCAGGDLSEFKHAGLADRVRIDHRSNLISLTHVLLQHMRKPVVAAIQGPVFGGGAGLAIACDMVVAARGIQLSYPELRNGIVPAIVMPGLERHVGRKRAFELASLGTVLIDEQLLEAGLVNRVVDRNHLDAEAHAIAAAWANCRPEAVAVTKQLFYRVADLRFEEAMAVGRDVNATEHLQKLAENPTQPSARGAA